MVLAHATGHTRAIVEAMEEARARWLVYRDGVCAAAGILITPER